MGFNNTTFQLSSSQVQPRNTKLETGDQLEQTMLIMFITNI